MLSKWLNSWRGIERRWLRAQGRGYQPQPLQPLRPHCVRGAHILHHPRVGGATWLAHNVISDTKWTIFEFGEKRAKNGQATDPSGCIKRN
jgi:hypothetical protein